MSYRTGDLELVTGPEEWMADQYDAETPFKILDARIRDLDDAWYPPVVCLPHSCDRWVIGKRAEVEAMIRDLQVILEKLP